MWCIVTHVSKKCGALLQCIIWYWQYVPPIAATGSVDTHSEHPSYSCLAFLYLPLLIWWQDQCLLWYLWLLRLLTWVDLNLGMKRSVLLWCIIMVDYCACITIKLPRNKVLHYGWQQVSQVVRLHDHQSLQQVVLGPKMSLHPTLQNHLKSTHWG